MDAKPVSEYAEEKKLDIVDPRAVESALMSYLDYLYFRGKTLPRA